MNGTSVTSVIPTPHQVFGMNKNCCVLRMRTHTHLEERRRAAREQLAKRHHADAVRQQVGFVHQVSNATHTRKAIHKKRGCLVRHTRSVRSTYSFALNAMALYINCLVRHVFVCFRESVASHSHVFSSPKGAMRCKMQKLLH